MRPLVLAFLLAACGGSSKLAVTEPTENVVAEEPPPPRVEQEEPDEEPPPPLDQASIDAGGTGSLVCDQLIARAMCTLHKASSQVPPEAVKAVAEGAKALTEALLNEPTRALTIDACKRSLDEARKADAAQGC